MEDRAMKVLYPKCLKKDKRLKCLTGKGLHRFDLLRHI